MLCVKWLIFVEATLRGHWNLSSRCPPSSCPVTIEQPYKSHNAILSCPTMHHSKRNGERYDCYCNGASLWWPLLWLLFVCSIFKWNKSITLHRLISAGIIRGCLWLSRIAHSPGREMLCTSAVEYNPQVFKGKHQFLSDLSSKSCISLFFHMCDY